MSCHLINIQEPSWFCNVSCIPPNTRFRLFLLPWWHDDHE